MAETEEIYFEQKRRIATGVWRFIAGKKMSSGLISRCRKVVSYWSIVQHLSACYAGFKRQWIAYDCINRKNSRALIRVVDISYNPY